MMTLLTAFWQSRLRMTVLLFVGFLLLYLITAAPDVQAGDSAEFQLAAAVAGVPHPTTYPLYMVLSSLMTKLVPFGVVAWRVTFVSVICGAAMVAWSNLLFERLSGSRVVGFSGALALGFTPGVWNAATIAEVYALFLLLMVAFAWALLNFVAAPQTRTLALVAAIGTMGSLYHGMFVLCAAPVGAVVIAWVWWQRGWQWQFLPLVGAVLIGVLPHAYPLVQYARFGPFDGQDYGLPTLYYWGAPQSWSDVFDLLSGGEVRRGIFQIPDATTAGTMVMAIARRMLYEFGPVGIGLGILGGVHLWRQQRRLWGLSLMVIVPSFVYVLALGPSIGDWPAFTLPMLLGWAVWLCAGIVWMRDWVTPMQVRGWSLRPLFIAGIVVATVLWGGYRYRVTDKHDLTLYREFASSVHEQLPPDAVVITHWEQGMTLQYLRIVEAQRPDVWIDVVEPGDDAWQSRAERRYPDRPVYFVGHDTSVAGIPARTVLTTEYAQLYQLIR